MADGDITFGFQVSAVGARGSSDADLYRAMLEDARYGKALGYDAVWIVEHHFSDYFPTPSPLVALSHIAGACPGLALGTMVLVTPWHQPLRLAGEIAMLSLISDAPLHLGLGRGSAPMEYEAFGLRMEDARQRFEECWRILDLALRGEPFTFKGEQFTIPQSIRLRPQPRRELINFYGAIGNPASATKIAELDLAPINNGTLPFEVQENVLRTWREVTAKRGGRLDVRNPVAVSCIIADTDEEAERLVREHMPRWFELQVEHYRADAQRHKDVPDYQPFAKLHARRVHFTNPDNLGPFNELQFFGSPETVRRRVQRYVDIGFNSFIVMTATPDIPQDLRQHWLSRFATEVAPDFSSAFHGPSLATHA